MPATKPWHFHADLTEDRLVAVAQLIAGGRDAALEIYDPTRGFNSWLLGCCAYQFGRFQIERAAEEKLHPWLWLARGAKHFIFHIGSVPVRFYRDDPDDPSDKVLRQSELEARQLSLALGDDGEAGADSFRLVVQTGLGGEFIRIAFLALHEGSTVLVWDVPLDRGAGVRAPLVPVGPAPLDVGVTLPSPAVAVRRRRPPADEATGGA
ncbi:hypothetical protein NF552_22695 (plasmid) [Roseomonas mucosa]|nr:hypothetical protein NF552_22695 [Roseomonas mucosa]